MEKNIQSFCLKNNHECNVQGFASGDDGSVFQPLPYETTTSFDNEISGHMMSLLKEHEEKISNERAAHTPNSVEIDYLEKNFFHETDSEQSDYIPSEDETSEHIQDMADLLDSYPCAIDSAQRLDDTAPSSSKTARKIANRLNKNLGKEYASWHNKKMPAKTIEQLGACKMMCQKKVNLLEQKKIFKTYWGLGDYNKRRQYISNMIVIQTKKTEKLEKAENPRNRQYVYLYHCEVNRNKIRVCKKCFLKIFGETDQSIKTVNKIKVEQQFGGLIKTDRRGKHAPPYKLSIQKYNEVIEHINSIPKYESHYSRRHTQILYFASGINLAVLYRLYTEKYSSPVSKSKYLELLGPLNIKFKKPQLDLCNNCEILNSQIANELDKDKKIQLVLEQKSHHDNADFAYECKKNDKELAKKDATTKMFSFDLQQCLPTPYLRANMFFYKRPLWTFNLTVHDGATKKADCYIWNETIAKRGANDIGSCLYKCMLNLPKTIRHVILYSDSCPGQNRNSYICAMFEKVLEDHSGIELIDHKFLVVGHTHLECDTVHAQIEKKKKKLSGSIQHTHDWANLIGATSGNYIVHELKQQDFYDFCSFLKGNYTWRTSNVSGEKFEWKYVRWMRYEKSKPGVLQYKLSLDLEEDFKELNIQQRRPKNTQLVASYGGQLAVSQNKKRDLLEMLPLINTEFHSFYQSIKAEGDCQVEIDPDLDEEEST